MHEGTRNGPPTHPQFDVREPDAYGQSTAKGLGGCQKGAAGGGLRAMSGRRKKAQKQAHCRPPDTGGRQLAETGLAEHGKQGPIFDG